MNIDTSTILAGCSVGMTSLPPRTGITDLDHLLGPWPRPLWLISAPRGSARCTLCTQIALTAAVADERPTRLVSLREDQSEVMGRLLAARAGVPLHHIHTGRIAEAELPLINDAVQQLGSAPLSVVAPTAVGSVGSVDAVLSRSTELEILVVDDADLWDETPADLLPRLRAWAKLTNTVVAVTAPDDTVLDRDRRPNRYWGRHCDRRLRVYEHGRTSAQLPLRLTRYERRVGGQARVHWGPFI